MLAWHVPFLGWRRMPADLSEFEIAHFFTLRPIEIHAVRSRNKESLRLGAALQLGFLKMSGRPLSALQRVPTDLLQHRLAPRDTPPDLAELREALQATLPMIHLPQVLVDVDAKVRFSWLLLGREPASEEELLYIYVALLGHAMDLGAKRLSLMAPGLSVSGLSDALQPLEEAGPLRRANAATLESMHAHPLAAHWGSTSDCAADAMSLDATRHLWLARTDPKRRMLSTATYVHTLARHGIAYDQPIPITRRQNGAAIEGALRQSVMPIRRVMTDTHGYSAFGMGLAKFVGVDLCPRLKSVRDRRLHIPRGGRVKVPD